MEKCKCYDIKQINHEPTSHYEKDENGNWDFVWNYGSIENVAVCRGTKECDLCSCGGDPRKCDFYEGIRREANKMKTLDMMNEAYKTHKTYKAGDMLFDYLNGFYGKGGHFRGGYAFENINDLFDIEWIEKPENEMTKAEVEAKFNIKIVD